MKTLILSADDFEDSELLVPMYRLEEAGHRVDVASVQAGVIRGMHGYEVRVDKSFEEIDPSEYGVLILPGGKAPAAIRKNPTVISIVHHFFASKKPVGAICHGPQTLITAGLMRNRRATCYRSVADELQNAGALYEDSEVVVDGSLVTSRQPEDLPAFLRELMKLVQQGTCTSDKYWGDTAPIPFEAPLRKLA
jgi:protease I